MTRWAFVFVFLACAGLLGYAYYAQYVEHLEPCPLCIIQRAFYLACGLIGLIAAVHHPRRGGARVYGGLLALAAGGGAATAGRQVWLQHLPADKVPECGPGLEYLLDVYPLMKTLEKVFQGSGECAEVDWTFLGLSMAEWSLAWFVGLLAVGSVILVRRTAPRTLFGRG